MSEKVCMKHRIFHIKLACSQRQMRTVHTTLSYTCISMQPAHKAVKYLINSHKLLLLIGRRRRRRRRAGKRRTGRKWMGVETRSQLASHCYGNVSLSLLLSFCLSLLLAAFCHSASYVTASRLYTKFPFKGAERVTRSDSIERHKEGCTCFQHACHLEN